MTSFSLSSTQGVVVMRVSSIVVVFSVLLLLMLGACANGTQTGQTQKVAGSEKPPQEKAQTAWQGSGAKEPSADDSLTRKFQSLLGARSSVQWKIDYALTMQAQGQTQSMAMTQYMKAEKVRSDVSVQGIESRTYAVDKTSTTCSKMSGTWTCYKSTAQEDNLTQTEDKMRTDMTDYTVVTDGTKTVAGVATDCFKVTSKTDATVVRYCFAADGAPLYVKMESKDVVTEMTATAYTKSVSDADFVPPAEPKDMNALTGSPSADGAGAGGFDACSACGYLSGDQQEQCLASCQQ
jgi:hypothetical protein